MLTNDNSDEAAGLDLIWGVPAIAKAINQSEHQTYYMLSTGKLPARKVGDKWVAVKSRLREFFDASAGTA